MTFQCIITAGCECGCALNGSLSRRLLNGIAFRYPSLMSFLSRAVKLPRLYKSNGTHEVRQRDINCQFTAILHSSIFHHLSVRPAGIDT